MVELGYPHISDIILRKSTVDLELFVSQAMKPVECTSRRLTPLHLVAAADWPEGIKVLVAGGADRYARDSDLWLPIDYACETQSLKSVELLLDGDCVPYFERSEKPLQLTIGWCMTKALLYGNDGIPNAIINSLAAHKQLLKDTTPYHDLLKWSFGAECELKIARRFSLAGYQDLDQTNVEGETPLMAACHLAEFGWIAYLLDNGADPSKSHSHYALTAGHFLLGNILRLHNWSSSEFERCGKIIQVAFDKPVTVESTCRCSPSGFTPVSAIFRSLKRSWERRSIFRAFLPCVRWSSQMLEEQVRAFALGEIFERLGMTHTCVRLGTLGKQIHPEDRLEIEDEEEESNFQLEEMMIKFDSLRFGFDGDHLDFLDRFLEELEQDLPPPDDGCGAWDWNDQKNFLGPGRNYAHSRYNFKGGKNPLWS